MLPQTQGEITKKNSPLAVGPGLLLARSSVFILAQENRERCQKIRALKKALQYSTEIPKALSPFYSSPVKAERAVRLSVYQKSHTF